MRSYKYRAVDASGNVVSGNLDASNERALETQLRQSGVELLRCAEQRRRRLLRTRSVRRRDLIGFCFHMEQMTRAGLPILEALADLRDSIGHPVFREVITSMIASVESGKTLSRSMAEFPEVFEDIFISLVAVGEESGELPEVLLKLTESIKWQDELMSSAKTIIVYPAFVGAVVLSVALFMMLFVVPEMVGFMHDMGQELPLHTLALIEVSNFMVGNWWWVVPLPPVSLILMAFVARHNPRLRRRLDQLKLRVWYLGPIVRKVALSRFANYFALCYGAGLDVLTSLKMTEQVAGNIVIQQGIRQITQEIGEGKSLSASVEATELFPRLVVRMVKMGEATGLLDAALKNVSYFYEREVSDSIQRLKAAVEPAMTVILGAIMGWIMLSVLGPIYDAVSRLGV